MLGSPIEDGQDDGRSVNRDPADAGDPTDGSERPSVGIGVGLALGVAIGLAMTSRYAAKGDEDDPAS